jgi:arylsulfatase A-like enzyme
MGVDEKCRNRRIFSETSADGMIEHDNHVGLLLKALDDLGISNDTIVFYTTDNGAAGHTWPDAGTTPFRSEKNTTGKAPSAPRSSSVGPAGSRRDRC